LQQFLKMSEVLEGTPEVLPAAQAMSEVGNGEKLTVEQDELLAEGAAEESAADIVVVGCIERGTSVREEYLGCAAKQTLIGY
jgi:hypothetical protein